MEGNFFISYILLLAIKIYIVYSLLELGPQKMNTSLDPNSLHKYGHSRRITQEKSVT